MKNDNKIFYSSKLGLLRGRIKHSWLENGIINKGTNRILDIWLDGMQWSALENEFREYETEAKEFGDQFISGFSPSRLVDHLAPLMLLPENIREELKKSLGAVYQKIYPLEDLQNNYQRLLDNLCSALAELRTTWILSRPDGMEKVKCSANKVVNSAIAFRDILEKIPKGIVIP